MTWYVACMVLFSFALDYDRITKFQMKASAGDLLVE